MAYTTGTTNYFANQSGGTLGILGELLDFVANSANQHTEVVGTGNGSDTVFGTTLSNTTIALGQCRISYKIGATEYEVWLNGDDEFVGTKIASGTLNRTTGVLAITFDEPITNLYDVTALYSDGSAGEDWLILLQQATKTNAGADAYSGTELQEVVLRNSGINGDDNVLIGIREWHTPASQYWSWNLNGYHDYGLANTDWYWNLTISGRSTYSGGCFTLLPSVYFKDNDVNAFKFASSKRRITGVVRTAGTLDMAFYLGNGKRLAKPDEHEMPLFVSGNYRGLKPYSDTALQVFQEYASFMLTPLGAYTASDKWAVNPNWYSTSGTPTTLKPTPGVSEVAIFPIYFFDNTTANPNKVIGGELEGWGFCPSSVIISGDEITVGGDTYLVFQDVHRTDLNNYYCLLEA